MVGYKREPNDADWRRALLTLATQFRRQHLYAHVLLAALSGYEVEPNQVGATPRHRWISPERGEGVG